MKNKIIDSHVHLDLIEKYYPEKIKWLKENNCILISWCYFEKVDSLNQLKEEFVRKSLFIKEMNKKGLPCFYLAGIHPRNIPDDLNPEQISGLLEPFLEDLYCKGIGEIGLETCSNLEKEVFLSQLETARIYISKNKVVGVHTPRTNKDNVTNNILHILEGYTELKEFLVIDHCTPKTIGKTLDRGYWSGITLSPGKSSHDDLVKVVAMYPDKINYIICNTDSGTRFSKDLVKIRFSDRLVEDVKQLLFYNNAARFFHINI